MYEAFETKADTTESMRSMMLYLHLLLLTYVKASAETDFIVGGRRVCQYCSQCSQACHRCDGSSAPLECLLCEHPYHCSSTCTSGVCNPQPCSRTKCGDNKTCYEESPGRGECRCINGVVCSIDIDCVSKGILGDCEFYTCFENRRRCGSDGYMLQYGRRYCYKFGEQYDRFTEAGKQWLLCARQCLTSALTDTYLSDVPAGYDCDRVRSLAFHTHVGCYIDCGFCDIWSTNKMALFKVYRLSDFFQLRAIAQVNSVAYQCITDAIHSIFCLNTFLQMIFDTC